MAGLESIREYDRVRKYLENIYLYGFFSREDFARAQIGTLNDYDYGVALIHSVFPQTETDALWQGGRKYLRFQRQYAQSGASPLPNSYMLFALDEAKKLPQLLWLCSLLSSPRTLQQLCVDMEVHAWQELPGEDDDYSLPGNYSNLRRRVQELVQAGYAVQTDKAFALRDDPLRPLTDGELDQLYDYVCFSSGVTYPRVVGSFLRRTLERERERRALPDRRQSSPFLLRHNVDRGIFDEDTLYDLLHAIRSHRRVEALCRGKALSLLPVALRADTRLGRWYLLAQSEGKPLLCRLAVLKKLKEKAPVDADTWAQAREQVLSAFVPAGCSGGNLDAPPVPVEAKLAFDSPGMRAQFLRELRLGEVEQRPDGEYYRALVRDPGELMPLLRAYSPWLRILPGDHGLDRRLHQDLLLMRAALTEEVPE